MIQTRRLPPKPKVSSVNRNGVAPYLAMHGVRVACRFTTQSGRPAGLGETLESDELQQRAADVDGLLHP
jgi:hypothetical protein